MMILKSVLERDGGFGSAPPGAHPKVYNRWRKQSAVLRRFQSIRTGDEIFSANVCRRPRRADGDGKSE
jgi:hypothetical protein